MVGNYEPAPVDFLVDVRDELALLSDNALGQQAADVDGVKAASKAFYAALAVLDNGEAMEKVWAHTPYVTYVGPRAKTIIVGWDLLQLPTD